jgi:hypothetical protein
MAKSFEIIELAIDEEKIQRFDNRRRNQLIGCMHAHNELTVLNRILMFSMNETGDGELHASAQSVQMWCVLQVLAAKIFETWVMLGERFLRASPEDPAIRHLTKQATGSLVWLRAYFEPTRTSAIKIIRDKTAFHYDNLNMIEAVSNLSTKENVVYLAQHPANSLYYMGSSLVFGSLFAMVADGARDTTGLSHGERTNLGFRIATEEIQNANRHVHLLLYELINGLLEVAVGDPLHKLEHTRIRIEDAPDPDHVGLPAFIDIGPADGAIAVEGS